MIRALTAIVAVFALAGPCFADAMVLVPAGAYVPFVGAGKEKTPVAVNSFWMDRYPVTRAEFVRFVRANPQWRKSKTKRLFADPHYLEDWKSDLLFSQSANAPITRVSWFAASAYCHAQDKQLPTTDQWEYAAAEAGRGSSELNSRILDWYAKPNSRILSTVGKAPKNGYGIFDLHGLVWEWTLDFGGVVEPDENLFCGNGSQGAVDATDYASFQRYSFRSSLKASYAVANLGFRCVKENTR